MNHYTVLNKSECMYALILNIGHVAFNIKKKKQKKLKIEIVVI